MAKGFGKGFVTGVAGYSCCCCRCSLYIQEKVIEPEEKSSFHRRKPQKQHVAVSHTNHSKAPETGAFCEMIVICF